MTQNMKPRLPIGYWLKQTDNLLTQRINEAQVAHGVSRFEWQVLNLLAEFRGASKARLVETMRAFVDASSIDDMLTSLVARGWAAQRLADGADVAFQLTEEGQRQHAAIFATQKDVRQRAMHGISEDEYVTTVRVLLAERGRGEVETITIHPDLVFDLTFIHRHASRQTPQTAAQPRSETAAGSAAVP